MTKPPTAALLSDLLLSFRLELEAQAKAPRTVELYSQSVRMFSEWLTEQGRPTTVDQLTRSAVRAWLAELAGTREPGTLRLRAKGLQRFTRWAVVEGELDADPMEGVDVQAAPSKPVPVLSKEQIEALLGTCRGGTFYDRRDEAIVRVLLDTGVRVAELCGIGAEDVDLRQRTILVTGKGSKIRSVYPNTKTCRALDRYMRLRRSHPYEYARGLFLGKRGPLTPDGVRSVLQERGRQAGIEGLHPHQFRHTFSHLYLANGGGERELMRLNGWSSPVMLERYGASAADQRARDAARRHAIGDQF
jgi:site-specific recombinase XerD